MKITEKRSVGGFVYYDDSIGLTGAASVRKLRNKMLADTDWTQVPDSPADAAAWVEYRQALRDITEQAGFPDKVNWPSQPKGASVDE